MEEVREDGTRVLSVKSPFGEGAFTVELGADMQIDPNNEADAVDIVNILNKGGMNITLESWLGRDKGGNPVENALTDDEKNAILTDPKWGFEKRGGISIVSSGGQKVDGRFLAFVEGKETLASGGEKTIRDVLSTSALHEQMHGVFAIMRFAAANGNAEAQALLDAIAKKFGTEAATEEDIADAFEAFALNRAQIADEKASGKGSSISSSNYLAKRERRLVSAVRRMRA